ncbi:putative oxidoreductase [Arthrobacter globiformis NBRC 12137]|uniref:Putative oxidoreductase n=1 Tax=Arthrobacter globiformis (strain ATCC 8010 / DSM 20124 / JCM 1332 / NBRC 12137 / NCIMB 8907 / NRRL B-2979 / 168) TaxID=1077972 RepID=H0QK30_ARTG1|nr:SDR family oxidoreductase [Arthrobacter globiformis]GAB13270.1 putative oxidoreductase [Arthrobacter globiformis NBRC 12137]
MTARTVVITGGSSGIGLATAQKFLDNNDTVIVLDRNPSPLDVQTVPVDLADSGSIAAAVTALPDNIDILCNVAGVAGTAGARTVLSVNFLGIRELTEKAAPKITTGGAVVNVASTSGWYWRDHLDDVASLIQAPDADAALAALKLSESDGYLAYNRAKEAVVAWTILAAQKYFGRFRINSVSPGPIQTPLLDSFYESMGAEELDPIVQRSGRPGTPAEIANVAWFLTTPESHWINGTDLVADFGAEAFLAIQDKAPHLASDHQPA